MDPPLQPASATSRTKAQKRPRDKSPVTPLKRRRTQLASSEPVKTPASGQFEYTATPVSNLRTREQLDRYHESVKRDELRLTEVKNKLSTLRGDVEAEPESSPEPTSGSTNITTKKAIQLLERIVSNNQRIEELEEERRQVAPVSRGPTRVDQDGFVTRSPKKEKTQRGKLRVDIRAARKRIAYAWNVLAAAGVVTDPDPGSADHQNAIPDNTPSRMPSPKRSSNVARGSRQPSRELVNESDTEPILPKVIKPIARSIKSTVSPEQSPATNGPALPLANGKEKVSAKEADDEVEDVVEEPKFAKNAKPLKPARQGKSALAAARKARAADLAAKAANRTRRSIYSPDSIDSDDEEQLAQQLTEQQESGIDPPHAAKEADLSEMEGLAGPTAPTTPEIAEPVEEEVKETPPRQLPEDHIVGEDREGASSEVDDNGDDSIQESIESEVEASEANPSKKSQANGVAVERSVFNGTDAKPSVDTSTDEEDEESSEDDGSDDEEYHTKPHDEPENVSIDDKADTTSAGSTEGPRPQKQTGTEPHQSADAKGPAAKVEGQSREKTVSSSTSSSTSPARVAEINVSDKDQVRASIEPSDVPTSYQSPPSHEPPSSRPNNGLFERMNGIQTSGSFEEMMADLRKAALERQRQAELAGPVDDTSTSDSSDDDSLPFWSPEPEAKPM
ncbi:Uncharacterized protein PECH_007866 [Penicillium ucsense]|uniref:Uncharacterized protein n=1 Tax=Penicillium ucsense TaxID=2839758 RepID=A0A8J8VZX7_9EURO|nr:Uncharacterized protein PECM_007707 [Penicillium ucsense]KAF7734590.1 Uncharacterized protein PECH_007866 [Penicillium ucsense]